MEERAVVDRLTELRYCGLVTLCGGLAGAASWQAIATAIGQALDTIEASAPVRLWGLAADEFCELAREPREANLDQVSQRDLQLATERDTAAFGAEGPLLVGLRAGGLTIGVIEVPQHAEAAELLTCLLYTSPSPRDRS